MWKAERMRQIGRKHNTDTGATKGDGEGQNSREEHNRRAENGQEQTEMDGDGWRMFENKFYVTALTSQNVGVFRFTDGTEFYGTTRGFVSGVITQSRKQIRTEY